MRVFVLTIVLSVLSGCAEQVEQTESQRRLMAVHAEAQKPLSQARELLTPALRNHPGQHLQAIFTVHKLLAQTQQVYRKAEVYGLQPQELSTLKNQLAGFNPVLAETALELMLELSERTLVLRKKVQKIRDAESGVGKVSGEQSIKRLSRLYNDDVDRCCLRDVYTIIEILHNQQPKTYAQVVQLGMRVTDEMVSILQDKRHAEVFRQRVENLRTGIPAV